MHRSGRLRLQPVAEALRHRRPGQLGRPPLAGLHRQRSDADVEVGRAVVFMANKGGAKFDEPKAPEPAASAASAAQ